MDALRNGYAKLYKYRRHIAGGIALALYVKNGQRNFLPEYLLVPYTASLECLKYPGEYQRWLVRITKRDCGYDGPILPYASTTVGVVSGGLNGFGSLKPTSYIGIPRNFYCDNMIEVSEIDLRFVAGKAIQPNTKNEIQLLESLVLSEAAQKYAVALHLMYLKGNWAVAEALLSPLMVAIGYSLVFHLPKFIFSNQSLLISLIRYQLVAVFASFFLCKLAWAQLYQMRNYSVAKKAAEVSDEYAQGAVEYYRKEREFNMACRVLLGQKGEKRYTALGNIKDGLVLNWNGPSNTDLDRQAKLVLEKFEKEDSVVVSS